MPSVKRRAVGIALLGIALQQLYTTTLRLRRSSPESENASQLLFDGAVILFFAIIAAAALAGPFNQISEERSQLW